jgi:hypothetical protein
LPEVIAVSKMISGPREVVSLVLCEAMAGKTTTRKPSEMAASTREMAAAGEMATTKMTTAATEAPTMAATEAPTMAAATKPPAMAAATKASASSAMATATTASTMCERGGGCERQNAGQNQTDK